MFLRSRSDPVACRFGGEHSMSTTRLHVVAARWSDLVQSWQLGRDPDARHWLGWGPEDGARLTTPPPPGFDPLQLSPAFLAFVGRDVHTGLMLASIGLTRRPDGAYEMGGTVDPEFRGRAYGREALAAVCFMAHQHFGIERLWAGCEATNEASRRWLVASQFVPVDGPPSHTLPDGRVIEATWWRRTDRTARRRCRNLPGDR